jgi:hypothetical protein
MALRVITSVAEQMEREWRRQLHTQEYLGSKERIRITDVLDQFIESKKGTPNHKNLCIHKNILLRLFDTNRYLDEITSQDLERLKRDRDREHAGAATIKHTFNLIRGAWKYGNKMGYQVSDLLNQAGQGTAPRRGDLQALDHAGGVSAGGKTHRQESHLQGPEQPGVPGRDPASGSVVSR